MPITPTFPGVYIDELPSAVRTITGVPTSVAAFVGTAPRGVTNVAVHITSWEDYEQQFGGLDPASDLGYAVWQFYQNGGSEAEIVRVTGTAPPSKTSGAQPEGDESKPPEKALAATIALPDGPILHARGEGKWANGTLLARVDYHTAKDDAEQLYNLTVRDQGSRVTEQYLNVSIDQNSPRALKNVIASSSLIGSADSTEKRPTAHDSTGLGEGADPFLDTTKKDVWYTAADKGDDGPTPRSQDFLGDPGQQSGIYALLKTDIFNMLCLPGPPGLIGGPAQILGPALDLCISRRAMLIVDADPGWTTTNAVTTAVKDPDFVLNNEKGSNAALYFPRVKLPDPQQENFVREFPPCGMIAGTWARTDVQRGVWKAPAGTEATLSGISALTVPLTDLQNGVLNPLGVNCLRGLPSAGNVIWGARTQRGADVLANQWKYLPVRRLALFIEESLFRGTQWVVFEPNDEPLWSSIRLNVGAFMNTLFRQGAFQGRTPKDAYLVKCDATNNPQNDIDRGIVNILVGFAPLKPAEFVLVHIQQLAGQIQV
ncbi:phage tail protein [Amycolatopsis sp. AA4]|uniref:phage tail sheath family protein n=1 Tax=Actinomycetes TaxID=1760 RepID=UPI0001B57A09|nr:MULTISPECIES: phage tail sheath C-terminal domain-containing protein [Actinomycetes]ATY09814.1 phage tail protein [Amycolatopsis sp. AA4]EFL05215.1 phage tail sheath protein [Streptomyces sp. AA4]